MDLYKVIIAPKALSMLNNYLNYIQYALMNEEAAKQVLNDAIETEEQLEIIAPVLQFCVNPRLRSEGYRAIQFKKHNYVMSYKIVNECVYAEAIYHLFQDYEKKFISDFLE